MLVTADKVGFSPSAVAVISTGRTVFPGVLIVIVESRDGKVGIAPQDASSIARNNPLISLGKYFIMTRLLGDRNKLGRT